MATLRYFMAVSVSAVISLGDMKLCTSQDLPSLIQSQHCLPATTVLPAIAQTIPAPEYLNPSANPLILPTRPEQVQIRQTAPMTLQQAQNLARRNNRELQTTVFTLERSRALRREAQASEYPTVKGGADLTRVNLPRNQFGNQR